MVERIATYRWQLTPTDDFAAAAEAAADLAAIGFSHLYLSPIVEAVPGSTHGYDAVDPTRIREALGGEQGFATLVQRCREVGMGLLVDIVPNHLAAHAANPWWSDVLRLGRESQWAEVFDVDWDRSSPPPADGSAQLVYRRFFDVDSLVATRVDLPAVFELLQQLPARLLASGAVDGLRIDHIDGLKDPQAYLDRLRHEVGPDPWLLVEKILRPDEDLPGTWPVQGTTGYEVADLLGGWLTDPDGAEVLTDTWRALTGERRTFHAVALEARREVLAGGLAPDVERVVDALVRVCEGRGGDHTRSALHDVVVEIAVHAPAYRSYVRFPDGGDQPGVLTVADTAFVATALDGARAAAPPLDPEVLDLLEEILTGRLPGPDEADVSQRFQQLTGPVAAKGEEDTALYRWLPLPHRCEVGADPSTQTVDADRWHAAAGEAQERWPHRLTSLSTHDTKRSADVRARLATLTSVPGETLDALGSWCDATATVRGRLVDDASAWLVFHTLVGAHALPVERAWPAIEKSVREAKQRTSWAEPDAAFEAELHAFASAAIDDADAQKVVEDLVRRVDPAGDAAALAQLGAQLLVPGVPDVYQGGEGWDRSLVDPDNRRPVDGAWRRALLDAAESTGAALAWADEETRASGLPRLLVLRAGLRLRRAHPDAFGPGPAGAYVALPAAGPDAARVLAFGRGDPVAAVVVVARPGPGAVVDADAAVELPDGEWTDAVTGQRHTGGRTTLSALHAVFPVALLGRSR